MRILACALALSCALMSSACGSDRLTQLFTAIDDAYDGTGNLTLAVGAGSGLLFNDGDGVVTDFDAMSLMGGDVSVAPDGSFTYDPPAGFEGVDTFGYENDGGLLATVTVTVSGMAWYIDDTAAAGGDGRFSQPFDTLAAFNAANAGGGANDPEVGEIIFVYEGSGSAYDGGVVLLDDQVLLGEGAGLMLNAMTIVPAGNRPTITNTGGDGVLLANRNTIDGLDITGTSLAGIFGQNVVGPTVINNVAISNTTGSCIGIGGASTTGTFTIGDGLAPDVLLDGSGVDGIFFSSGGASLELLGAIVLNAGFDGVDIRDSHALIEDCYVGTDAGGTVGGVGDDGIKIWPAGGDSSVVVRDTVVANCNSTGVRILNNGPASAFDVSLDGVETSMCSNGLDVSGSLVTVDGLRLAVDDCTFGASTGLGPNVSAVGAALDAIFVTSFSDNVVEGDGASAGGILFDTVSFDADPGTALVDQVAGGTLSVGTLALRVDGDGVRFDDPTGDLSITTLNIFNDSGTGLYVDTKGAGTTFNLATGGGSVNTTNGAALFLDPPPGMPPLALALTLDAVRGAKAGIVDGTTGFLRVRAPVEGGLVVRRSPKLDISLKRSLGPKLK